jgi:CRP/FNR family transcriptional regulator, anaerobic regulatory protein
MDEFNKLKDYLEPKLIEEIRTLGNIHTFKEGEIIMDYGKKIRFMPLVLSGTIKVLKRDEDGKEILLYYLGSNESCAMAYACCMEDKKSEIKAVAEDEVKVVSIPHEKLDEWLMKYSSWKSYIFGSFTLRFNELLKSFENVAFKKLDDRLVGYLKDKARLMGKNTLQLSHSKIAEELGSSRVVISRLLKQLENDKKLLLYRNEIKLLTDFSQN